MADISTGKQRGIVPFVDETTGRLPDQYLPQGVIDLQGDLEQAVTGASQSATAAKASETAAKASATAADSSAQAAAVSAESAQTATESAASSKDAAARSASAASESAQAAETSETNAAASASAAETSKTNAASSASAAKASETNAAASATAARQAVDGFGLEVGTTTTGEPGSDAAVEIQKTGTKYTANFTIPRGDKGADGVNENVPLGTASGIVAQATDAYPALPRKVRVHGRTINNLWVNPTGSSGGFTASQNADGSLHISGTGDSNASTEKTITLSPSTQYTLACNESAMNIRGFLVRENLSTGGHLDHTVAGSDVSGNLTNTFTTSPDLASVGLYVLFSGGQTVNDDYKLMLVEGDTVPGAFVPSGVNTVEPTKLIVAGKTLAPVRSEVNLPSDISLADGDTLTIDRDGTTQIVHAEGEPTVLENVTLPELPVPTFNVYTTGGSIQPTVDVDYEKDVNLVLEALEAKIAALQLTDKTN